MTDQEREIIAAFIARVGGAAGAQSAWGGASVPATQNQAAPLPPIDPEADRFIAEQFQRYPEARYRITQLAFVQEHALIEAQNRIRQLEWAVQQAQQHAQEQQQSGKSGGFFSSLFGGGGARSQGPSAGGSPGGNPWGQRGGQQYAGPQPPPQYPPGYQPGVFQQARGSGFLGSALTTAAGVAGGVLAADAIRSMFTPHYGFGGGMGMGGAWGGPWGMPVEQGYVDQGAWTDPAAGAPVPDQGYVDQGTWDQGGGDQAAWNDPGPAPDNTGGGWDQGGGDPGGDWGGGDPGGGVDPGGDWGGGGGSDDSLI